MGKGKRSWSHQIQKEGRWLRETIEKCEKEQNSQKTRGGR